jgi:hypothetical protein
MSRGRADPSDKEPTFQEFVNFLLNTDIYSDDEHWQPVALRCRSAINCTLPLKSRKKAIFSYIFARSVFRASKIF